MTSLSTLQSTLKLLSDATRLRLLGLLAREELAVQELVAVTGLPQSRVSNHLALLRRAGLVRDRREGSWSFHSLVEPTAGGPLTPELFAAVLQPWLDGEAGRADATALEAVREQRRERSRRAHDALADRWVEVGQEFRGGSLRAEALAALAPRELAVADLGCGAGYMTSYLAPRVARVIAVDHAERMLEAAQRRLAGDPVAAARVEFRSGELESLPLGDAEVDAVFANLVWHHVSDMDSAAREVLRVLRPGGVVVLTDLLPHQEDWMRERMGDLRLGVRPDAVLAALARAGFLGLSSEPVLDRYHVEGPAGRSIELPLFLVRGTRPAGGSSSWTSHTPSREERTAPS
ncbi:MAG: metalloregulator ArsR/SmtB family transcription factor [Planctomycetes bacterium]|nr:metalloregulator ArsR/SmtB family transcription factor [Planctomycetota bacterium]